MSQLSVVCVEVFSVISLFLCPTNEIREKVCVESSFAVSLVSRTREITVLTSRTWSLLAPVMVPIGVECPQKGLVAVTLHYLIMELCINLCLYKLAIRSPAFLINRVFSGRQNFEENCLFFPDLIPAEDGNFGDIYSYIKHVRTSRWFDYKFIWLLDLFLVDGFWGRDLHMRWNWTGSGRCGSLVWFDLLLLPVLRSMRLTSGKVWEAKRSVSMRNIDASIRATLSGDNVSGALLPVFVITFTAPYCGSFGAVCAFVTNQYMRSAAEKINSTVTDSVEDTRAYLLNAQKVKVRLHLLVIFHLTRWFLAFLPRSDQKFRRIGGARQRNSEWYVWLMFPWLTIV